jgi:hypothetical protein
MTRRSWKAASTCAVAALGPLVAWQAWLSHAVSIDRAGRPPLPGQSSYLEMIPQDGIAGLAAYMWTAVRFQLREYPPMAASLFAGWPSPKAYVVLLAFSALAVWGFWRLARERTALVLSMAAVIALLLLWNSSESRYVAPVLPVAGLGAAYAVERVTAARSGLIRRAMQGGMVLVAVLIGVVNVKLTRNQRAVASARGTFVSAFREVSAWILANTRPDDRILIEYGAGYYLRTGRQTVIAVPEDGGVGRVGSIDRPGTYFAQRILEDTVTVIVNHRPAGLNGVLISASLSRIAEACPRVLQPQTPVPNAGDSVPPAYYRVVRDETCLRNLAER